MVYFANKRKGNFSTPTEHRTSSPVSFPSLDRYRSVERYRVVDRYSGPLRGKIIVRKRCRKVGKWTAIGSRTAIVDGSVTGYNIDTYKRGMRIPQLSKIVSCHLPHLSKLKCETSKRSVQSVQRHSAFLLSWTKNSGRLIPVHPFSPPALPKLENG